MRTRFVVSQAAAAPARPPSCPPRLALADHRRLDLGMLQGLRTRQAELQWCRIVIQLRLVAACRHFRSYQDEIHWLREALRYLVHMRREMTAACSPLGHFLIQIWLDQAAEWRARWVSRLDMVVVLGRLARGDLDRLRQDWAPQHDRLTLVAELLQVQDQRAARRSSSPPSSASGRGRVDGGFP